VSEQPANVEHAPVTAQTRHNMLRKFRFVFVKAERVRNIRFNKDESAFAQHILNKQHQYGPMTTIMEVVEYVKKGNVMNIKENFHIYHRNKKYADRKPKTQ
jgi:hypothetical protein